MGKRGQACTEDSAVMRSEIAETCSSAWRWERRADQAGG